MFALYKTEFNELTKFNLFSSITLMLVLLFTSERIQTS